MRPSIVLLTSLSLLAAAAPSAAAELNRLAPAPALVLPSPGPSEVAYFAGGCFWGIEGVFDRVRGVRSAVSGYSGGRTLRPTYASVGTGTTGHAETVRVTFDPRAVGYADLLRIYFSVLTDPTQLNRQGPDHGPQYRGALFPASAAQDRQARAYLAQLRQARLFRRPIVTRVERLTGFTVAEAEHQDFMARHPFHPYIVINDAPKLAAFRRLFPRLSKG